MSPRRLPRCQPLFRTLLPPLWPPTRRRRIGLRNHQLVRRPIGDPDAPRIAFHNRESRIGSLERRMKVIYLMFVTTGWVWLAVAAAMVWLRVRHLRRRGQP